MLETETAWIERFLRHLGTERRLSPLTCRHYGRDIEALAAYCDRQGLERWRDLDSEHIRAYSAASFRRGMSPRSIQRSLSAARTFFRYLLREKHVKKNPVDAINAPKGSKRLPGNLDVDRMARLLDIPGDGPIVARDRAILELLYSSGLRLAELIGLNLTDLDMADGTVHVTGKGSKDRIVPVGRMARQALAEWQRQRSCLADPDEAAVFVSQRGTRLSARSVQARVDYWAKRQGTPSHPTCSSPATICAAFRNSWVMRTSARRRFTLTLTSSIWPRYTTRRTHGRRPRPGNSAHNAANST